MPYGSLDAGQHAVESLHAEHGPQRPWTYWLIRIHAKEDQWSSVTGIIFCRCKIAGMLLAMLCMVCSGKAENNPSTNLNANADPTERSLWQIAIQRMKEKGGYVAACVETDLKVFDGDEKLLGSVTEVQRMEQVEGKSRWVTQARKKAGHPGMAITADFGLQSNPASSLEGYDQWHLRRMDKFEGGQVEIWEGITKADPQNSIIAYIDPASGFLKKAEFTMPFRSPVGSIIVKGEITCQRLSGDIWLPTQITMDQTGRLFFIKRHLRLIKTYKEWQLKEGKNLSAIPRTRTDD